MKDDGIVMLIVLAGLALLGIFAWRRGVFTGMFAPPGQLGGYPQPFPGGLGPREQGPAGAAGGDTRSTFQKVCSGTLQAAGKVGMTTPDPRLQAAGAVAQVGGPAICAVHEYAAELAWDGTKYVAKGTASAAKSTGKAVGGAAKSVWNNTLGKLF